MKLNTLFTATAVAAVMTVSSFAAEGWMSNFEAAKKKAIAENKQLLVDFTGSDWCGWCIRLDKEVFQKPEFKGADKFVLVSLDFPKDKTKVTKEIQAQNKMLQKRYAVKGFPTILLMDAKGMPFAKTGYQAGGPEKYNTHLEELLKKRAERDTAFAAASKIEDKKAQATAYADALKALKGVSPSCYSDVVAKIVAADPENRFIGESRLKVEMAAIKSKEAALAGVAKLSAFAMKHKMEGEDLQKFFSMKINALIAQKLYIEAEPVLEEIIAIDPSSSTAKNINSFKTGKFQGMLDKAMDEKFAKEVVTPDQVAARLATLAKKATSLAQETSRIAKEASRLATIAKKLSAPEKK